MALILAVYPVNQLIAMMFFIMAGLAGVLMQKTTKRILIALVAFVILVHVGLVYFF